MGQEGSLKTSGEMDGWGHGLELPDPFFPLRKSTEEDVEALDRAAEQVINRRMVEQRLVFNLRDDRLAHIEFQDLFLYETNQFFSSRCSSSKPSSESLSATMSFQKSTVDATATLRR